MFVSKNINFNFITVILNDANYNNTLEEWNNYTSISMDRWLLLEDFWVEPALKLFIFEKKPFSACQINKNVAL